MYVNVCVSKRLKEELAWAINKRLQFYFDGITGKKSTFSFDVGNESRSSARVKVFT